MVEISNSAQSIDRTGAIALRDAVVPAQREGRGRPDAPLIGCRFKAALALVKEKRDSSIEAARHPSQSFVASWITEAFHLLDPQGHRRKGRAVHRLILCAVLAYLSDKGPSALPRIGFMDDSLREDQAARSHRPSRR